MAAIFPADTSQPWVYNGVTYEYDATEERWSVVSSEATDQVVESLDGLSDKIDENVGEINTEINDIKEQIEDELETRDDLIATNTGKNAAQDAAIAELDARVDSISENIGILEFKGIYTYVTELSEAACTQEYANCLSADGANAQECNRLKTECLDNVGNPLADGTFTSVGANELSAATELIITNIDKEGNSLDWENVLNVGDFLELSEPNTLDGGTTGGDTVLFEVITDPTRADGQENIRVKYIKETGNGDGFFDEGIDYTIRVFRKDLGIDINEADERYLKLTGGKLTGDLEMSGGDEATGANICMFDQGFIRFGYAGGSAEQYGGYAFMRDDDNFEIGTYTSKNLNFKAATSSYDGKVSMNNTLTFGGATSTNKDYIQFINDKKANQTSILKVHRPYSIDNATDSDTRDGNGGLDIKLLSNSDGNYLRVLGGSGAGVETLRISGGGNGRQIHAGSSIGLAGGSDERQTVWAENGTAGHLSYNGVDEGNRRLSWGASKVWVRNAALDLTNNQIINISGYEQLHQGSAAKKFIIKGETAAGDASEDFFYSYKNNSGTLDAMNYNGKMDSGSNLVNVQYVTDALNNANLTDYVKKSGDTMTGILKMDNDDQAGIQFKRNNTILGEMYAATNNTVQYTGKNGGAFKITGQDSGGNSRTFFDAKTTLSSGTQGSDSGYRCKIYHLQTPTDNYHAANKKYVDDQDKLRVEGRFKITNSGGNYYIEPN